MVITANSIVHGLVHPRTTMMESHNMAAILQLIGWQRHAALVYKCTSSILEIHVIVNWHLSKPGICWPVLHEHTDHSFLFLTSGDAKRWNKVFKGTPICKCVTHSLTHSLRCRHRNGWNGWNGWNCAVRARRHIEIETAHHQITQKQRTFVAIQYNKYLVLQNIYLFK